MRRHPCRRLQTRPSQTQRCNNCSSPPVAITSAGQGLVIIEIDKRIFTLKKGATLSLSGERSQMSLQLTELSREGAAIEVLPLKQTIRLP
jgi:hypothetical protein